MNRRKTKRRDLAIMSVRSKTDAGIAVNAIVRNTTTRRTNRGDTNARPAVIFTKIIAANAFIAEIKTIENWERRMI